MGEDANQAPSVVPMLATLDEHNFYTAQQGYFLFHFHFHFHFRFHFHFHFLTRKGLTLAHSDSLRTHKDPQRTHTDSQGLTKA